MTRYDVAIFGNKNTTGVLIAHLVKEGMAPDLVITVSDDVAGRADISGYDSMISSLCAQHGIGVYHSSSYNLQSPEDAAFFAERRFGLGLCTGWQRLIPPAVLSRFSSGVFGWHGSMFSFPNGRGRSPLNWSLRLGGSHVQHNCFRYAARADDGPVFETAILPVEEADDIRRLQYKALAHIKRSAARLVASHRSGALAGCLRPQAPGAHVTFPKLSESDGEIFLDRMPCEDVRNLVRSCSRPFPGAFLRIDGRPAIRVWRCSVFHDAELTARTRAGEIADVALGLVVARTTDGLVMLEEWEAIGDAPVKLQAGGFFGA